MTTRITSENITDATITATDLAAGAGSTDWQAVIVGDGSTVTTMVSGRGYFVNTTSAAGIVKFPASASRGDYVEIKDYARTFDTNNVTVQRNGHNIDGNGVDAGLDVKGQSVKFVYMDSTKGWSAINDEATSSYGASYISATGGTVTTSGNFKIHTFTGDGNFVVASVGNPAGSNEVSYVVVGGGAGGGPVRGGGGGAGGFREGKSPQDSYTSSPLTCTSGSNNGLPVSAQTYPITVGAGGSGGSSGGNGNPTACSTNGGTSTFSTITSGGGGHGTTPGPSPNVPNPGASGGGGNHNTNSGTSAGGAGNVPPVSPPQGTPGGSGIGGNHYGSGGGGGATAAGTNGTSSVGGPGGAGATTSINGSSTTFAGGGGGSVYCRPDNFGTGGAGGGGAAVAGGGNPQATAGTANTGGGGGGGYHPSGTAAKETAGAGGKGIVIIRYKFQ